MVTGPALFWGKKPRGLPGLNRANYVEYVTPFTAMLMARSSPATSYKPSGITSTYFCCAADVNSGALPLPSAVGSATTIVLLPSAAETFGSVNGMVACARWIVAFFASSARAPQRSSLWIESESVRYRS